MFKAVAVEVEVEVKVEFVILVVLVKTAVVFPKGGSTIARRTIPAVIDALTLAVPDISVLDPGLGGVVEIGDVRRVLPTVVRPGATELRLVSLLMAGREVKGTLLTAGRDSLLIAGRELEDSLLAAGRETAGADEGMAGTDGERSAEDGLIPPAAGGAALGALVMVTVAVIVDGAVDGTVGVTVDVTVDVTVMVPVV